MGPESLVTIERADGVARHRPHLHRRPSTGDAYAGFRERVHLFDAPGTHSGCRGRRHCRTLFGTASGRAAMPRLHWGRYARLRARLTMTTITAHITRADQARQSLFLHPLRRARRARRGSMSRLAYPKAEDCVIDLGAFDPRDTGYPTPRGLPRLERWRARPLLRRHRRCHARLRAWRRCRPGRWNVILGLYKVPEAGADVDASPSRSMPRRARLQPAAGPHVPGAPAARAGIRGDLHCHTFHSDAQGLARDCCTRRPSRPGSISSPLPTTTPSPSAATSTRHPRPTWCSCAAMEVTTAAGPRQCLWRR